MSSSLRSMIWWLTYWRPDRFASVSQLAASKAVATESTESAERHGITAEQWEQKEEDTNEKHQQEPCEVRGGEISPPRIFKRRSAVHSVPFRAFRGFRGNLNKPTLRGVLAISTSQPLEEGLPGAISYQPGFCVNFGLRSIARCGTGISLYLSGIGPPFAFGNLLVLDFARAMLASMRAFDQFQLRWLSK
jgi:hypothetical protein